MFAHRKRLIGNREKVKQKSGRYYSLVRKKNCLDMRKGIVTKSRNCEISSRGREHGIRKSEQILLRNAFNFR